MSKETTVDKEKNTIVNVELPDASEVNKRKLQRDVERAEQIQKQLLEQRKTAPKGVSMGLGAGDEMDSLAKRWLPESIGEQDQNKLCDYSGRLKPEFVGVYKPGATMQGYFDAEDQHDRNLALGWIPVVNGNGDHVRTSRGSLFYKRAIELTRDAIKFAGDLSRERMRSQDQSMGAASKSDGLDITEDVTEINTTK